MKIGDRCFVHGYVDEIRKDVVIIKNKGGYFGTDPGEVITVTNTAHPNWIPCSERLPENGYWLWSAKGGEVQKDFYWDGHWEHAEKYGYEVVAWMPLPEPYKEASE